MSHTQRLEVQRAEKVLLNIVHGVSIWGIPLAFAHHHILFHSCRPRPLKKENFQKNRPVLDNVPVNSKSTVTLSNSVLD